MAISYGPPLGKQVAVACGVLVGGTDVLVGGIDVLVGGTEVAVVVAVPGVVVGPTPQGLEEIFRV